MPASICPRCNKKYVKCKKHNKYRKHKMCLKSQFGHGVFGNERNEIVFRGEEGEYDDIVIPSVIMINGEIFNVGRRVGDGSYGVVYGYENEDGRSVVLKIGDISSDLNVINKLKQSNITCNQSIVPYETVDNKHLLIMEKMDGDLYSLTTKTELSAYSIKHIIHQIATIIKCLLDVGIFYTDLKLENILYKLKQDDTPLVILGDLGSADNTHKENMYISTYPPYDRKDGGGYIKDPNENDLSWMIGIILIDLCCDVNQYGRCAILKLDEDTHKQNIEKFSELHPQFKDIILGTLSINPDDRIRLDKIIEMTR